MPDQLCRSSIRVGISVFAKAGAQLWSSGLNQNLAFLVHLLRQSERIGRIVLLNGGDVDQLPAGMADGIPDLVLVQPSEVTHELDLVIEMGAQLPLEWLRHVRALGTKIVTFFVGHSYAEMGETPIFGREAGHLFSGTPWHEVWTLPHHMHASGPMLRTLSRVPVHAMPHIWSPMFLEQRIRELGTEGLEFGFQPAAQDALIWRAGVFEPNISVVKNATIPMLACESAYRQDHSAVERMMVMSSFHMKEHPTFHRFAAHLDITRSGLASYEPRLDFAEAMTRHRLNVVVSHQWECGLNYLYYDALYGGYPLLHNSPFLQAAGVGLFYPGFEAGVAGDLLLSARRMSTSDWVTYRRDAQRFLRSVAPEQPAHVQAFMDRITALVDSGGIA
ncbi:DUF2827 domain-containing protein [Frateuria aurantia]|uniref:DUF2827 domain-containing protein n=1 Tax=Frateuria aurantia (strain ATCC 33424 / DSM 6220 / KCTC 2777 / LMG 1558 / NBRC 3245 / NCIMB 13370) TaxID=767434 RepID=H8L4I7_FRAAD|nr:DUF2827 domain-containing protein [Frateuria aurantia]AFC85661.1 Protein of unknown function (DUF2827) [Frateuria aurantia DSM 6220]